MLKSVRYISAFGLVAVLLGCQGAGFGTSSGLTSDSNSNSDARPQEAGKSEDQDAKPIDKDSEKSGDPYELSVQWPPNHRMERFTLESIPTEDDLSVCALASISSNEVDQSAEDDDMAGDCKILDDLVFEVRIERLGEGDGRIYSARVVCGVEGEEAREHVFKVIIPHDWRHQGKVSP